MAIKIPGVRNIRGADTADIIAEQIALCESNLRTIDNVAFFRKEREKRDEINRRLRGCNDFLGMAGSRKDGCLYREVNITSDVPMVCEHAIPVTALVSLYEEGFASFEKIAFYPVALISKMSDKRLGNLGLVKSGHDNEIDFKRYNTAGIRIETHEGNEIDTETWSIKDHWALLKSTPPLANIKAKVRKILEERGNVV